MPCTAYMQVGQRNGRKEEGADHYVTGSSAQIDWISGSGHDISGSKRCLGQRVLPNNHLHFILNFVLSPRPLATSAPTL